MSIGRNIRTINAMGSLNGFDLQTPGYSCAICTKIAKFVLDGNTNREEGCKLGNWGQFKERIDCKTCQMIVRTFTHTQRLGAMQVPDDIPFSLHYSKLLAGYLLSGTRPYDHPLELFPPVDIMDPLLKGKFAASISPNPLLYHRPLPPDRINLATISSWVRYCDTEHQGCRCEEELSLSPKAPEMRLIDLKNDCLIETHGSQQYVCLSYVWGNQDEQFALTKANEQQLSTIGSLRELWRNGIIPKTICDAAYVTTGLGCRYLWVDRLCIAQDNSEEIEEQIRSMHSIYANSYITLVAADGADADTGLGRINQRGRVTKAPWLQLRLNFNNLVFLQVFYPYENSWGLRAWHKRAWTFQERYLSKRCLVFHNDTVSWECCQSQFWECFDEGQQLVFPVGIGDFPQKPSQPYPDLELYHHLAKTYSSRQLSKNVDAENAFKGILSILSQTFPGGFIFGIPAFSFEFGLSWGPLGSMADLQRREGFPSWSWLGWKQAHASYRNDYVDVHPFGRQTTLQPVTRWTIKVASSGTQHEIESNHHEFRKMKINPTDTLPQGWELCVLDKGTFEYASQSHGYTHHRCPGKIFGHPMPIPDVPFILDMPVKWSPYLYFKTQLGVLDFKRIKGTYVGQFDTWLIETLEEQWVGVLEPTIYMEEEIKDMESIQCDLVIIAEGHIRKDSRLSPIPGTHELNFEEIRDIDLYEYYLALWVGWEEGIAYRKGIARVWKEMWDKQGFPEKDIILG